MDQWNSWSGNDNAAQLLRSLMCVSRSNSVESRVADGQYDLLVEIVGQWFKLKGQEDTYTQSYGVRIRIEMSLTQSWVIFEDD